ncbi:MAG: C2 domain-containing protein [Bacteroidia bacterium]
MIIVGNHRGYGKMRAAVMLLLALCGFLGLAAQPTTTGPNINEASIIPDLVRKGLHGFAVILPLHAPDEPIDDSVEVIPAGPWIFRCQVTDRDRFAVPLLRIADDPVRHFVGDSLVISRAHMFLDRPDTMFFPYCLIDAEAGRMNLVAHFTMRDASKPSESPQQRDLEVALNKPLTRLVRLHVERLLTAPTDAKGETWDYRFFNPKDVEPDLQWQVRIGELLAYSSEKQKNDTIYRGTSGDITPWILISEGDKLLMQVNDHDLLGAHDLVGQTLVDVDAGRFAAGVTYDFQFGQVRAAKLKIDAIVPPRVLVPEFEVVEGDPHQGLSGVRVRLRYDQRSRGREAEFHVRLVERMRTRELPLPKGLVLGAGAMPDGEGGFRLTSSEEDLELFVPHFYLKGDNESRRIRMEIVANFEGQQVVVGREERMLVMPPESGLDFVYGQWTASAYDRDGEGGIRLTLDYDLPQGYFSGLANAHFFLKPNLKASWGPVKNRALEPMERPEPHWQDSVLRIDVSNRVGRLDLFLPYRKCAASDGKVSLDMRYDCKMVLDGESIPIGERGYSVDLQIPKLRALTLGIREAAVKRSATFLAESNLYWVLRVGEREVYRSKLIRRNHHPHWREEDVVRISAETDAITLEVRHHGAVDEPEEIMGVWSSGSCRHPRQTQWPHEGQGAAPPPHDGLFPLGGLRRPLIFLIFQKISSAMKTIPRAFSLFVLSVIASLSLSAQDLNDPAKVLEIAENSKMDFQVQLDPAFKVEAPERGDNNSPDSYQPEGMMA